MRRVIIAFLGLFLGVLSAPACDDGIGSACNKDADCNDGQICDVHDGKGTCQEPHGHETDDGADASGSTDGHDHEHTDGHNHTDGHDHEHTSSTG